MVNPPAPHPLFDTLENLPLTMDALDLKTIKHPQDYLQACLFLYSYRGSLATFNSYRRELEHLLQWCWHIENKKLNDLTRTDIENFVEFCQAPPATWIATSNVRRFMNKNGERQANPDWRPFTMTIKDPKAKPNPKDYMLSQKGLQALFAVLSSFFNFLIQEDYLERNPVSQLRQKSKYLRKQQTQTVIRRLTELQWGYVVETAEYLAEQDPYTHERTLFIMNALYGMYLRVSELAASERWTPEMGHFFRDHDEQWWFSTVGKGNKARQIAVSDAMLSALKRYRSSMKLSPLPAPGDTHPLLPKMQGRGPINSTRRIRGIVQHCFDASCERLRQDGFELEADQMKAATVHWLRHTGISDDVKHRPREHVRDDAGHGSSAITDKYVDVELQARHASSKRKALNPFSESDTDK